MKLTLVDGLVILAYFALNLGIGLYYRKRATRSVDDFFVSGRNVSWWLAGTSMVATTFGAAYMSTIGTELNWGASYLVNDLYRRFLVPGWSDRHYVGVSQVMTMLLMVLSAVVTFFMSSIADAWKFMIAVGAGLALGAVIYTDLSRRGWETVGQ